MQVVFDCGPFAPWRENLTSSAKPDVHNLLHWRQRGTKPRPKVTFKPRPHQQQCRSHRQHCRSYVRLCRCNIRFCCHKQQQCRTSIVKFRPFDNDAVFGNNVAGFGNNVERNFGLSTKAKQIEHVEATFDIAERIVKLVAYDNVAWTLLLVWTGL